MEYIIAAAGIAIYLGLRLINKQSDAHQFNLLFKSISKAFNLKFTRGGIRGLPRLNGTINDMHVIIDTCNDINNQKQIMLLVYFYSQIDDDFEIQIKNPSGNTVPPGNTSVIKTGDDAFDKRMRTAASSFHIIAAMLTEHVRKNILYLASECTDLHITKTSIRLNMPVSWVQKSKRLVHCLKTSLSLAKELAHCEDYRKRIIDNISGCDEPKVKLRNIHALVAGFGIDQDIRKLLRKTMRDDEIAIRIESASHLGKEGCKYLTEILIEGSSVPTDKLKILIVKILKERRYTGAVLALIDIIEKTSNRDLITGVLEAFEAIGDERVSTLLMVRLNDEDSDIRLLAIRALASCGTVSAVEPLHKLAGDTLNPMVRIATLKAIERIQSRLGNVERGWLSVAELSDREGALSMADGAGKGSLSMAPEKFERPPAGKKKKTKKSKSR